MTSREVFPEGLAPAPISIRAVLQHQNATLGDRPGALSEGALGRRRPIDGDQDRPGAAPPSACSSGAVWTAAEVSVFSLVAMTADIDREMPAASVRGPIGFAGRPSPA
jgi:hypothetical protein